MNEKYRIIIEFLTLKGYKNKEIYNELHVVYGDSSPCIRTIETWAANFRRGENNYKDFPRSGRKKIMDNLSLEEPITQLINNYPFISAKYISNYFSISYKITKNILTKYMKYKRYHIRWVPYFLSEKNKELRVNYSKEILNILKQNEKNFFKKHHNW